MENSEKVLANYINDSKTFHRCVSDLGGQVRALEMFYDYLLRAISHDTHTVDYIFVLKLVHFELLGKYPFRGSATIMKQVVAHAILNIPVDKYDEIKNDDNVTQSSYVDLSSKGIINLEAVPNDILFYVRMPYMWVWILTSLVEFKAGEFWDVMIDQESHILWQDFEDFNVRFWVLRLQLFKELYERIKIRDLFKGTHHTIICPLLDHEFQLPAVQKYYFELESRYPDNVQEEHLSPGTMYKNCAGAPWDHFLFLDDFLIAIQDKSSDATTGQPQVLSEKIVEDEYKKVKEGFEILQKSFNGESPIKHWVLLICTNGSRSKTCLNSLKENCFVVDRENFKDFYGYTFSTRAEFSADNDQLDANTAEEYELKTIRGIGKEIASDIYNKRPFKDEDDLYKQVNRIPKKARKMIKVTKKD